MKMIKSILTRLDYRFWIITLIVASSTAFILYYNYVQSNI